MSENPQIQCYSPEHDTVDGVCMWCHIHMKESLEAEMHATRAALREVLAAWKWEADQGDGIDERHAAVYERALKVLPDEMRRPHRA